MDKRIVIPNSCKAIKPNHLSLYENYKIFACDTETYKGDIFTLQIKYSDGRNEIYEVNPDNAFDEFMKRIDEDIEHHQYAYVFFHNLSFDIPALLKARYEKEFLKNQFEFKWENYDCSIYCSKTWFGEFINRKKRTKIFILDTHNFLPYSLKKIADDLHLDYKKLDKPEGLGEKKFDIKKDKNFVEYALQDTNIQYEVAKFILQIHKEFKARISVSLPQLSARIFRHYFLKKDESITLPPLEVINASLLSYHGGKNGLYTEGGFYKDVAEIDLNSAYPYAMKMLPSFLSGEYCPVKSYQGTKYVGIYCVSGKLKCPYNIFFDHEFKPIPNGDVKDTWITCYELEEALKYKEFDMTSCYGYIWIPESDKNPMADYVDYFYKKKQETPKTNSMYHFYKLALNSLYGKFIQAVEINDSDDELGKEDFQEYEDEDGNIKVARVQKTYKAGGLFNPFIATLITGKVRAMIHDLEHRYKALHTATDSIKTTLPISGCSDELGGYKLEVRGDCLIIRNKFYLHFDEKKKLKKYALHSFWGDIPTLLKLYDRKETKYEVFHLYKMREAIRQDKKALSTIMSERTLNIDWSKFAWKKINWREYDFSIIKNFDVEDIYKDN
jgi:hypothetical protein